MDARDCPAGQVKPFFVVSLDRRIFLARSVTRHTKIVMRINAQTKNTYEKNDVLTKSVIRKTHLRKNDALTKKRTTKFLLDKNGTRSSDKNEIYLK